MFNYLTDLGGFGVALFFLFSALGGMISRVAFRLALLNDVYDTQQSTFAGLDLARIAPLSDRGATGFLRSDDHSKASVRSQLSARESTVDEMNCFELPQTSGAELQTKKPPRATKSQEAHLSELYKALGQTTERLSISGFDLVASNCCSAIINLKCMQSLSCLRSQHLAQHAQR